MELGEVEHEKEVLESRKQTLHPHSTCNINIPKEHISKIHTENAVLLHNCLYLRLAFQNPKVIVKIIILGNSFFSLINIMVKLL